MKYSVEGKENETLLVFVNGAGVSKWMWKHQNSLCNNYKCLYFDLPGHGDNSDVDFITIDEVCMSIINLIKKESVDNKAIVIGLSIGAQIVLSLIKSYSEHISRAVVISGLNKPLKKYSFFLRPMIALSMPFIKNRKFSRLQSRELSLPEDWFEDYYKDSLKITKGTLINITKENMSFNFDKEVDGIPTMILVGEREKNIMKKSAHKTAKFIKKSRYYIIKDAGHGIPYENPQLFNRLLTDFIINNNVSNIKGILDKNDN